MHPPSTLRRAAAAVTLGIGLLLLTLVFIPGLPTALERGLLRLGPLWLITVLAATLGITTLTAAKWRLVTRRLAPEGRDGSLIDYTYFVALSALAGLVLPRQLGVIGSRTAVMRQHRLTRISTGFGVVLADLALDLVVPALALAPALLALTGVISGLSATLMALGFVLIAAVLAPRWLPATIELMRVVGGRVLRPLRPPTNKMDPPSEQGPADRSSNDASSVRIFLMAAAKVALIVFRAWIIVLALGLPIHPGLLLATYPLVQLAFVLSLTPAGLGFTDWTWIGGLSVCGVGPDDAAAFAITLRLVNTAAVVLVAALASMLHHTTRSRK